MTEEDVLGIIEKAGVPDTTEPPSLVETHISWVLLTDTYAYKIKKPLKFSFLDFSTLEKRKLCCEEEVALNTRLAPEMYLGVLPVTRLEGKLYIDGASGDLVDYVVWMRRMDETRQMDVLMEKGLVEPADMERLAVRLAAFHKGACKVPGGATCEEILEEFTDIGSVAPFVENQFGKQEALLLAQVNQWVPGFLKGARERIRERDRLGFVIDGHGDLHCRNIFLENPPVIFDCIEFNEELRSLDMLNEIAFLCMDLERYKRPDLAGVFLHRYLSENPVMQGETDRKLFVFYKMYRANVRIKVHCIHQMEESGPEGERKKEQGMIRQYLDLYRGYFEALISG